MDSLAPVVLAVKVTIDIDLLARGSQRGQFPGLHSNLLSILVSMLMVCTLWRASSYAGIHYVVDMAVV